jgi:transposase
MRVWLAAKPVGPLGNAKRYMRKGFDGLAAIVQQELAKDPFGGHLFVFRGKRGNRPTFRIPFRVGQGRVSLAPASRA